MWGAGLGLILVAMASKAPINALARYRGKTKNQAHHRKVLTRRLTEVQAVLWGSRATQQADCAGRCPKSLSITKNCSLPCATSLTRKPPGYPLEPSEFGVPLRSMVRMSASETALLELTRTRGVGLKA